MQALNHSTHCLQEWRSDTSWRPDARRDLLEPLMLDLECAVKFMLPDGGRVLDDPNGVARVYQDLRLPFPVVALEYRAGSDSPLAEHEFRSSKRIALVWDARQATPAALAGVDLEGECAQGSPGLWVQSIAWFDHMQRWAPVMALVHVDLTLPPTLPRAGDLSEDDLALVRHRMRPDYQRLAAFPIRIVPYGEEFVEQLGGIERAESIFRADAGDEITAALSFAALTTCANVEMPSLPAPAALNKKRQASGKVPFFDMRVLKVAEGGYAARGGTGSAGAGGGGASPRAHLRRGHIRRLDERNVWVNAAVVNGWKSSPAAPRYALHQVAADHEGDGDIDLPRPRGG